MKEDLRSLEMNECYKKITKNIDTVSYAIDMKTVDEMIEYCNELKKEYSEYDELFFEYETEYDYSGEQMVIVLKGKRSETYEEYQNRIVSEQDVYQVRKEQRRTKWKELNKEFKNE